MTVGLHSAKLLFSGADVVLALVAGMLVGLPLSLGMSFFGQGGMVPFLSAGIWLRGLAFGLVAAVVFALVFVAFDWNGRVRLVQSPISVEDALSRHPHRVRAVATLVVMVLWIPAFACVWPGDYTSDAPMQVTYYLNDGFIDLHWPAAHTLVLLAFFKAGLALFGSYDAGLTAFCLAQGLLCAFALVYAAERCAAWGAPRAFMAVVLLLVALNPVVQTYVFATTKDSLFMPFFALGVACLVGMVRASRGERRGVPAGTIALLAVALVGMCLMRKQALYVVVVALPFIILALAGARPRAVPVGVVVLTVVVTTVFSPGVEVVFPVHEDSAREMLSLPSQQVVRTYMLDYDSLSPELIEEIGTYYDLDALEAGRTSAHPWLGLASGGSFYDATSGRGYLEPISDPAKAALIDDAFARDKVGYVRMWLDVMRGHEGLYAEAFCWGFLGYLYPGADASNYWTGIGPWNEMDQSFNDGAHGQVSDYNVTAPLAGYRTWLFGATNSFSTVFTHMSLPFYVLLVSATLLMRRRMGRRLMSAWFVPALYWAVLCLAPVACLRYVVPLFGVLPLLLGMPFVADNLDAERRCS